MDKPTPALDTDLFQSDVSDLPPPEPGDRMPMYRGLLTVAAMWVVVACLAVAWRLW